MKTILLALLLTVAQAAPSQATVYPEAIQQQTIVTQCAASAGSCPPALANLGSQPKPALEMPQCNADTPSACSPQTTQLANWDAKHQRWLDRDSPFPPGSPCAGHGSEWQVHGTFCELREPHSVVACVGLQNCAAPGMVRVSRQLPLFCPRGFQYRGGDFPGTCRRDPRIRKSKAQAQP